MRVVAVIASMLWSASACDTAEELARDTRLPYSVHGGAGGFFETPPRPDSATLTLLPQDKGKLSPACLDGSPYGFYFSPSPSGKSTKWTISIEGGGWCYDEHDCYNRSLTRLGSSKDFPAKAGCGCMNTEGDGIDHDCNCLYMPYGDGASFSGYREQPWPVPGYPGKFLTFRGIKNIDATVEWAFANAGLEKATEFVLTGGSAGGLSTFLHADRVAARVRRQAPHATKIVAAPVVGYFLDHDNFLHTHGTPNTPSWNKNASYTAKMRYIYQMQNMTFGEDGGLTEACQRQHPSEPGLCFMSPHVVPHVATPLFIFNSKYDQWQLNNIFQSKWQTPKQQQGALQYGVDFLKDLTAVEMDEKNGAFITSCVCHGCPWSDETALNLPIDGKSVYQHYAAWMAGNTTGAASIHIDPRGPNGDGNITSKKCYPFPGP